MEAQSPMLLVGFGIIKNNWNSEDLKKKHEKEQKAWGFIMLIYGIINIFWDMFNKG